MRVLEDQEHRPLAREPLHLRQENAKEPRLFLLRRATGRRVAPMERQPHQLGEQRRRLFPEVARFVEELLQLLELQ